MLSTVLLVIFFFFLFLLFFFNFVFSDLKTVNKVQTRRHYLLHCKQKRDFNIAYLSFLYNKLYFTIIIVIML